MSINESTKNALLALRAQLDVLIASAGGDVSAIKTTGKKASAVKAEKKPRANAGVGTAWSAFSSKIQKEHKDELDIVKAEAAAARKAAKEAGEDAPPETKGAHLHWCSTYKEEHDDEWKAFKAEWELAHPKGSKAASAAVSSSASVAEDSDNETSASTAAPKKRGIKKDSECTPEELAERKAKRAATKAAKAVTKAASEVVDRAASVMAPAAPKPKAVTKAKTVAPPPVPATVEEVEETEEEAEDKLIPFTHKGKSYLRFGHLDEDGDAIWDEGGDLWLAKEDGSKGAYQGVLTHGKIDSSPAVLAAEPDIA